MKRPDVQRLARRIRESDDVLLHAGPALLADTGLPTDRLAETVWGEPDGQFTIDRFETEPEAVWADWLDFWDGPVDPATVSPQPVHERVAELVAAEHVSTVVTESVFGLFREAGVPTEDCIQFHGRVDEARCRHCGRADDAAPARAVGHRQCPVCLSTVGPGIVLAGEPPARADRFRVWTAAESCDLYLAVGTQLTVHPTAENAEHAVETGADLVVVGERPTALDGLADRRFDADPAATLARLRDALTIWG